MMMMARTTTTPLLVLCAMILWSNDSIKYVSAFFSSQHSQRQQPWQQQQQSFSGRRSTAFLNKAPFSSKTTTSTTRNAATSTTVNGDTETETINPFLVETSKKGPSGSVVHTLTIYPLPGENKEQPPPPPPPQAESEPIQPVVEGEADDAAAVVDAEATATITTSDELLPPPPPPPPPPPTLPLVIEVGKIGRQAAGAVTLTRGDTVMYVTACRDDNPKEEVDFVPLSVEHQERFSSAGLTSGSYTKRDGRPAEHEVLTCRLIDRPIRPLIAHGWRHETQILSWVLSYDGIRSCDPLAIIAASAALVVSDIPLLKPIGAVMVGYINDQLVLNPTNAEMEQSKLHLTIAGTKDAVLMIEGAADFLPESLMIEAVQFGHQAIQVICQGLEALGQAVGVTKKLDTLAPPLPGLQQRVDDLMTARVDDMLNLVDVDKIELGRVMYGLQSATAQALQDAAGGDDDDDSIYTTVVINTAFKDLLQRRLFHKAKTTGLRCDGRKLNEIRKLEMETGFLPRVHGSALFTRGETQAIATVTLGGSGMKQKIDKLDGLEEKRFYLQYTFPPSCVGETGRVGAPGRRELGHGNLAERSLLPTLPPEESFPYTIRVESLITESHGSSSMASVCGGCLALMDAGVPIKKPVAGIAMGMLLGDNDSVSDENALILSDILGTEDALGTMDFKVAGDREGITAFQLDIKCEGLTLETMQRALEQAREGRLHLLDEMDKVLAGPRSELPPSVPKMSIVTIPPESIGKIIGPGGKQIRAIIEDFKLEAMDVDDDGTVQLTSFSTDKLVEAEAFIRALIGEFPNGSGGGGGGRKRQQQSPQPSQSSGPKYQGPEAVEGTNYLGKITGIHPFGVFVEILPGAEDGSSPGLEGLCHVSELARERVRNCEGFVRSMNTEQIEVKYLGVNEKGQLRLSRKAVLEERMAGRSTRPDFRKPASSDAAMSEEELDVIAKAIEGITDL